MTTTTAVTPTLDRTRRLWVILALTLAASFAVLLGGGYRIYQAAPPIPEAVVGPDGARLFGRSEILRGQSIWRAMGGQQVGSIWGHGAYQAPDWSGDWLHREATTLLEVWAAREHGVAAAELSAEVRAGLEGRLKVALRTNTHDAGSGVLRLSGDRVAAFESVGSHYDALFGGAATAQTLRENYALPDSLVPVEADRRDLCAFFWWTSWVCSTNRPGSDVTYTNNWPHEPLIDNVPSADVVLWSILSIFFLLAGIAALAWYMAATHDGEDEGTRRAPAADPLAGIELTPSMRATTKYFLVAAALFALQVAFGVLTVHYTVEGQAFFGFPLAQWLPYPVTRTWHIQLGIFWIATCFLATGLFVAPLLGGHEPKGQRLGVNVLFGALVLVVVGSLAGEWASVQHHMGHELSFWLGHQGYEYVELGRVWQIALYGGLLLWLGLMGRALWPALAARAEGKDLSRLLFLSTFAIGTLYGAGLMWGADTHLAVAEYWRWWVIHLWVEGFFEVFATAAIALLFVRLGLLDTARATAATLFATVIFLAGGIIGTFHHLYFSGTPMGIMALGASFSAMEVVPLVLIGFEAIQNLRLLEKAPWVERYRWPITFFVGVCFWNLVGAGLFGFLINPPIALYYMQGLNTTPVHGHTALFGVYGLLSLGLMLFCLRPMSRPETWDDASLRRAFWGMNIGLALMVLLSLLPIGLLQAKASMAHGMWYARSAEFLQQPWIVRLRWLRMVGDLLFVGGVASLGVFLARLRGTAEGEAR